MSASASVALQKIVEDDWDWRLKDLPEFATAIGDHQYDSHLDDRSLDAYAARISHCEGVLAAVDQIDLRRLSKDEQVTLRLLQHHCGCVVRGGAFRPWLCPINRLEGPHIELPQLLRYMPFAGREDYNNYVARLSAFPKQIGQVIALMQEGIMSGMLPPLVSQEGVPEQIQASVDALAPAALEKSDLWRSAPDREEKDKQEAAAKAALAGVQVAFQKLRAFVEGVYVPAIKEKRGDSVACLDLPQGDALYRECLRFHTGSETITAAEIHRTGVDEVHRIAALMRTACEKCGLAKKQGDSDYSDVQTFLAALKKDPRFTSSSAEEHVMKYRAVCMSILPELCRLFSINAMPRTPFGVVEMSPAQAEAAPAAYYLGGSGDGTRPGCFFVNTSKLQERPFYEAEALALHEAVPGHHTQTTLAAENDRLPEFRRFMDDRRYSEAPGRFPIDGAFIEGWGLYAESLGEELNQYNDPYQMIGRLSAEMFRACRLVVDTGIHSMGWTPQRAMDYMAKYSAATKANIDAEVKRYCTWPGQATGYKMGELYLQRLRNKFTQALGDKADIRKFHDIVLLQGVQPLYIVEELVDQYIEEQCSGGPSATTLKDGQRGDSGSGSLSAAVGVGIGALVGALAVTSALHFARQK